MIRLIPFAALLLGLGSLSLSPTGCTAPEDDPEPVEVVVPTSSSAAEEPAAPPDARTTAPEEVQVAEVPSAVTTPPPVAPQVEQDSRFAPNAFPPVLPDTERHQRSWLRDDCLRCHETGVEGSPQVIHADMPAILLAAKCRTCHVLVPGTPAPPPAPPTAEEKRFAVNAFPPMIPASGSHSQAWVKDDCLLCHEDGVKNAPVLKHEGLPPLLLRAKCRTCHVQVRAVEASEPVVLK